MAWPIRYQDVLDAGARIRPWLAPTPLVTYGDLDRETGARILVKHEEKNPTRSFKARNGLAVLTAWGPGPGVVAATRGNHGLGVAWAGSRLGVPVTICVPRGNSPAKNAAIRELGAELVEEGKDYDESVIVMRRLVQERGLRELHSTELTFPALCEGLEDFVTVTDTEIADALRTLRRITDTTPEGAGAAGLAGLLKLELSRQAVAIVISGANIDADVLQRALEGRL